MALNGFCRLVGICSCCSLSTPQSLMLTCASTSNGSTVGVRQRFYVPRDQLAAAKSFKLQFFMSIKYTAARL
ncbi:uncharacterized protein CC84DRAFT_937736 [Paraphaeosphaeria sporulosa]|uniref:Uncharacterized protein n=1 Tax=Paraphaeosphaeria sporulosa TaxID=1460663 RepID=A0A177C886_9PLEO|nr:uncharacterized protein CC84DRAFT_937736 [Paraphaeosphaeria sporulosa]OAG02910.1 hypothetical protein CC84DRAFT_937736 [Paraphaeosphaeria sporulosa]